MRNFIDLVDEIDSYESYKFDYHYSLLVKLKEQGESTKLAQADRIKINKDGSLTVIKKNNKDEYNDESLIKTGDWLYRNQDKLSEEQKNKLREIGYFLSEKEILFEKHYSLLVKLKEQGESTNLAPADKLKINEDGSVTIIKRQSKTINGTKVYINKDEYNDRNLISIGSWLSQNQKKLDETQKAKLREIGYILKEDKKKKYKEKKEEFDTDGKFEKKVNEIVKGEEHKHGK